MSGPRVGGLHVLLGDPVRRAGAGNVGGFAKDMAAQGLDLCGRGIGIVPCKGQSLC